MGKLSDLDLQIKELRSCGETIIEIANTLAGDVYKRQVRIPVECLQPFFFRADRHGIADVFQMVPLFNLLGLSLIHI